MYYIRIYCNPQTNSFWLKNGGGELIEEIKAKKIFSNLRFFGNIRHNEKRNSHEYIEPELYDRQRDFASYCEDFLTEKESVLAGSGLNLSELLLPRDKAIWGCFPNFKAFPLLERIYKIGRLETNPVVVKQIPNEEVSIIKIRPSDNLEEHEIEYLQKYCFDFDGTGRFLLSYLDIMYRESFCGKELFFAKNLGKYRMRYDELKWIEYCSEYERKD